MKIILLFIFASLISCSTAKVQFNDIQEVYPHQLKGNIKEITLKTTVFPKETKDTITYRDIHQYFFNDENKVTKWISKSLNYNNSDTTLYQYQNNLFAEKIYKDENGTHVTKMFYDKNKNRVKIQTFNNGKMGIEIENFYDKKNNISEVRTNMIEQKSKRIETYKRDYATGIEEIITAEDGKIKNDITIKKHFNEKGIFTKSEFIYNTSTKRKFSYYTLFSYNKNGDLDCRNSFYNSGKPQNTSCFKYKYDEKGNIILEEMFSDNALLMRSEYKIMYR